MVRPWASRGSPWSHSPTAADPVDTWPDLPEAHSPMAVGRVQALAGRRFLPLPVSPPRAGPKSRRLPPAQAPRPAARSSTAAASSRPRLAVRLQPRWWL
jgi:hypothetical protein